MKTLKNVQYQYIPAQELINELKNELYSYFNQGSLDESHLYPRIKWCLGKMGLKIYPSKQDILFVDNYQAKLPRDFYKLQTAIGCFQVTDSNIDILQSKYEEVRIETLPECSCSYDFCQDNCGMFQIVQKFDTFTSTYNATQRLRVSEDARPYCTNECFVDQPLVGDQITVKNGRIHTSFASGKIYIEYLSNLETEDGDLMIPDSSTIREWIKDELRVICFRILYDNGGDFIQRYQNAKADLTISQMNAKSVYTRSEFSEWYDLRKVLYSRFHKFNTSVYGKYYAYPTEARSFHDKVTGLR